MEGFEPSLEPLFHPVDPLVLGIEAALAEPGEKTSDRSDDDRVHDRDDQLHQILPLRGRKPCSNFGSVAAGSDILVALNAPRPLVPHPQCAGSLTGTPYDRRERD